jgi:tripartite-type tricarboxylate transporter receptor subunit TctC
MFVLTTILPACCLGDQKQTTRAAEHPDQQPQEIDNTREDTIMHRRTSLALIASAIAGLAIPAAAQTYPNQDIQGVIQWGAGGSTDVVMRAITPHAEKVLGRTVIMTNRTGGVGAIAMKFVQSQRSDGYTLLMGAENPQLYKVMGLSDTDYTDSFTAINVIARGIPVLVANKDAPYNTMKELVAYAKANPGKVRVGSTGPGGLPSVVMAMIGQQEKLDLTAVPYDGDGPALTALQGGAIDIQPAVLGVAIEAIKAGRMKPIAVIDTVPNPALPNTAPIVADYPGMSKVLPWGPFFGIFVKKDTPAPVVATLQKAFAEGAKHPDFVKLIDDRGFKMMNIVGPEADKFLSEWQSATAWIVHEAGIAKRSPADFNIPKR